MKRRHLLFAGLFTLAALLALGTGTSSRAGVDYTRMVNPAGISCGPTATTYYTTIHNAISEAVDGDTIFVCSGTYPEPTMQVNANNVSVIGPGSTPEDDGAAIVLAADAGFGDTMFIIDGDNLTISGLSLDLTPPTGSSALTTVIAMNSQLNATIADNVMTNVTSNAIYIQDLTKTGTYHITNNQITSSFRGLYCECTNADVQGNVIHGSNPDGITAIDVTGDDGNISGNMVTAGFINSFGSNWTVSNNTIDGNHVMYSGFQAGYGTGITLSGNHLIDTSENVYSIQIVASATAPADVTVKQNTFESVPNGIILLDNNPADAFPLTVTIGGASPADANVFTNSGGTLDDGFRLLYLIGTNGAFNAENNNWGLCTREDIEQEIYHHPDQPNLGTVDYDPFIKPASCPTQSWGNIDCDELLGGLDVLKLVLYLAELPYEKTAACPDVGTSAEITVAAESHIWGDLDCSGTPDVTDALDLLAYLGGVPYEKTGECPDIGDLIFIAAS